MVLQRREKQRQNLAVKAITTMAECQDSILVRGYLQDWWEKVAHARGERLALKKLLEMEAEVQKYLQQQQVRLKGCVSKWATKSYAFSTGIILHYWRNNVLLNAEKALFSAELQKHQERQRAMLQGCVAKWGSKNQNVMRTVAFRGWFDLLSKAKQLRHYARKAFITTESDPVRLLQSFMEIWKDWWRQCKICAEKDKQRTLAAKALMGMATSSARVILHNTFSGWQNITQEALPFTSRP